MLPDCAPTESLKRAALKDYGEDSCCMFVCHPGYLDDYILRTSSMTIPRTKEATMSIGSVAREWLAENDVSVVTYDEYSGGIKWH